MLQAAFSDSCNPHLRRQHVPWLSASLIIFLCKENDLSKCHWILTPFKDPHYSRMSRVPTKFCKDSQDLTSTSNLNFVLFQTTFPVSHHHLSSHTRFLSVSFPLLLPAVFRLPTFSSDLSISSPCTSQLNCYFLSKAIPELPVSSHGTMYLYFREFINLYFFLFLPNECLCIFPTKE